VKTYFGFFVQFQLQIQPKKFEINQKSKNQVSQIF
jgi:hypothetical protein